MAEGTVVSKSDELREGLRQFSGTEHWYKMPFSKATYTDGVKYFAETAGAYWFLDIVATELAPMQRKEEFIHIILSVANNEALIRAGDGNENNFWSRKISFTDCPEGDWHFYLTNNVLLLPGEY